MYDDIGISETLNGPAVKSLSIWPNSDYINVWIVHAIADPGIAGYSTLPGAAPAVDGVVLLANQITNSALSTHEFGHYFGLYHTFQGGTATVCPINTDCTSNGDRVCDTPPHLYVQSG